MRDLVSDLRRNYYDWKLKDLIFFINVKKLNFKLVDVRAGNKLIWHIKITRHLPICLGVPSKHAHAWSDEYYLPGVLFDQHNGIYAYA